MSTSGVHMLVSRQIVGASSGPGGLKNGSGSAKRAPTARRNAGHHFVELRGERVAACDRFPERVVEAEHDDLRVRRGGAQVAEDQPEVGADLREHRRRARGDAGRFQFAALDQAQRVVGADVDRDRVDAPRVRAEVGERIGELRGARPAGCKDGAAGTPAGRRRAR